MTRRRRIALGWGLATAAAALLAAGAPGVPRDEAETMALGPRAAGLARPLPAHPAQAWSALADLSREAGRPLLGDALHGLAAEVGERAGLDGLRSARAGAALVAGLLAAVLALAAFDLAGALGATAATAALAAVLAPLVLFLAPRVAGQALLATPDALGALLWLAALGGYARSLAGPTRLRRTHAGLWAGVLAGLAAAVRLDLWTLLPILAAHWLLGRLHLAWLAHQAPGTAGAAEDWAARLRRVPIGLLAALIFVPAAVALAFPWLALDPLHRALPALAAAHGAGVARPVEPLWLALLAMPAALVALAAVGLAHAVLRLAVGLRHGDGDAVRVEALILLATLGPLALAATGLAPPLAGLRPALHAFPLLALLGARALAVLGAVAWPARRLALSTALGLLVLAPAASGLWHAFPTLASAWGEPLGGAAGAAMLGLPPQDGGEAARGLLPALALHAAPSARVLWVGVPPGAVARYRRAGLLRADLVDAAGPAEADLAVVARASGSRDLEYRAWSALGTSRAVATAALDEVALAQVFARAGAWR